MNELFSNEPNRLYFYCRNRGVLIDPISEPDAWLDLDGLVKKELTPVREAEGVYYVAIDQQDINDRHAEVEFFYELEGYGTIRDKQKFEISRRIVSFDEVLEMLPNIKYNEFEELERTVRGVIEVYCKQRFNYWYGIREVRGNEATILLPQYLDKLESISKKMSAVDMFLISTAADGFDIADDGLSIKNDRSIETRKSIHGRLRETDFKVLGQWGYVSVPTQVKQAAAALIQQKLCPDSVYRERFVETIRNENINIRFSPETYNHSTGNADADKLLAPYRVHHMGVI